MKLHLNNPSHFPIKASLLRNNLVNFLILIQNSLTQQKIVKMNFWKDLIEKKRSKKLKF